MTAEADWAIFNQWHIIINILSKFTIFIPMSSIMDLFTAFHNTSVHVAVWGKHPPTSYSNSPTYSRLPRAMQGSWILIKLVPYYNCQNREQRRGKEDPPDLVSDVQCW